MAGRDVVWLANAAQSWGVDSNATAGSAVEEFRVLVVESSVDVTTAKGLLEHQKQSRKVENAPSRSIKVLQKLSKINPHFVYDDYRGAIRDFLEVGGNSGIIQYLLRDFWQDTVKSAKTKLFEKRNGIVDEDKYAFVENLLDVTIQSSKHTIETSWLDVIGVMTGYSRKDNLNKHLDGAIQREDLPLAKILLQRSADPNLCVQAIQSAIFSDKRELVRLILRSRISWRKDVLGECLLASMSLSSTQILQLLLTYGADVNQHDAIALYRAIDMQRLGVILMILTAKCFPTPTNVDRAVGHLFKPERAIDTRKRYEFLEVLLHGGAAGDHISQALVLAVRQEDWDAGALLISRGASTRYKDGEAFLHAVSNGKLEVLRSFEQSLVGSLIATKAFSIVLQDTGLAGDLRIELFRTTLKHGAQGKPVHDGLIAAVKDQDIQATRILLDNHASVNHCSAEALRLAITTEQWHLVELLLRQKPSRESLRQIFPSIQCINRPERRRFTEQLLVAGVRGDVVDDALFQALSKSLRDRDHRLIEILVCHGANVNQENGSLIRDLVLEDDEMGVKILLKGSCSNETLCAALAPALERNGTIVPLKYVQLLLEAGADGDTVSDMLIYAVDKNDEELAHLLLRSGKSDVNFRQGNAVQKATALSTLKFFALLVQYGTLDPQTKRNAFLAVLGLPRSGFYRRDKIQKLLPLADNKGLLNECVALEVDSLERAHQDQPEILSLLFDTGAAADHEILWRILGMKAYCCLERVLKALPYQKDVDEAFLHSNDKQAAQLLLSAGVSSNIKGTVLVRAVDSRPRDVVWITRLLDHGASVDYDHGSAVTSAAARDPDEALLGLLLSKWPTPSTLEAAFTAAVSIPQITLKVSIYHLLLDAGVSGQPVDEALVSAAKSDSQDLELSKILIAFRASVDHDQGAAILIAIHQGHLPLLTLLLGQSPSEKTLFIAFDAAMHTQNADLQEKIYDLLLRAGVRGRQLDEALIQATALGHSSLGLCDLLLEYNASVNYREAAALCATISGSPCCQPLLYLLLEHSPSQKTIYAALCSCVASNAEERSTIMEICLSRSTGAIPGIDSVLFKLGLVQSVDHEEKRISQELLLAETNCNQIHEPQLDYTCIQLVLEHDAMIQPRQPDFLSVAVDQRDPKLLSMLLRHTTDVDIVSGAFKHAFDGGNYGQSPEKLSIVSMLLQQQARGAALDSALVKAIQNSNNISCQEFVERLLTAGASVNYNDGLPLQIAAGKCDLRLVAILLEFSPTKQSVSFAFPHIFLAGEDAAIVSALIDLFCTGQCPPDMALAHFHLQSPLALAFALYPSNTDICTKLIRAGCSTGTVLTSLLLPEYGPESVTMLMWALNEEWPWGEQPHTQFIQTMVEEDWEAVDFNSRSPKSSTTPLILAVRHSWGAMVAYLLRNGASVHDKDKDGRSAMFWAMNSRQNDFVDLLLDSAGPKAIDDGSLHQACLQMNVVVVQKLLNKGHNPNKPCLMFGGRGALAELCLHTPKDAKAADLKEMVDVLLSFGANVDDRHPDKSLLLLALDSKNALEITQAVIDSWMWDHMNDNIHQFQDDRFCYSPVEYVSRGLNEAPGSQRAQLVDLLKTYRCKSVFYAVNGEQPDMVLGAPAHINELVQERQRREYRRQQEEEDLRIRQERERQEVEHRMALAKKEAAERLKISEAQHLQELARDWDRAKARDEGLARSKELEIELNSRVAKQGFVEDQHKRDAEREHRRLLGETHLQLTRRSNEQELEHKQKMQVETLRGDRELNVQRQKALDYRLTAESQHEREITQRLRERADIDEGRVRVQRRLIADQTAAAIEWQKADRPDRSRAIGWREDSPD